MYTSAVQTVQCIRYDDWKVKERGLQRERTPEERRAILLLTWLLDYSSRGFRFWSAFLQKRGVVAWWYLQ